MSNLPVDRKTFVGADDKTFRGLQYDMLDGLYAKIDEVSNRQGGMPDQWETVMFGDLSQTAIGDYDSDGYLNIEEYANGDNEVAQTTFTGMSTQ